MDPAVVGAAARVRSSIERARMKELLNQRVVSSALPAAPAAEPAAASPSAAAKEPAAASPSEDDGSWHLLRGISYDVAGVDVPAVDLVVFADPKQSHVDILQCMGRASRLSRGKEFGYILVPTGEAVAEDGRAVSVMRAYAEQDAEFAEGLRSIVREEARMGRPPRREEWPEAVARVVATTARPESR